MNIRLEPAHEGDLPLMMAWRSNPLVYEGFYTQRKPLVWFEHLQWWRSRNKDWRTFFIWYDNRPVGVVTIGQLCHWSPEVGYYVGEVSLWGQGIGRQAVWLACEKLKRMGYKYTHTTVLKNNKRSIKLLKRLGFEYLGEARDGEIWMTKKLAKPS